MILLAESDLDDAERAARILGGRRLPGRFFHAEDGDEALDLIFAREGPLIVLLALELTKVNGLEVLRRMKADPRTAGIPVMMMVPSDEARAANECRRLGADSYVVKPVDAGWFGKAVENLVLCRQLIDHRPKRGGLLGRWRP